MASVFGHGLIASAIGIHMDHPTKIKLILTGMVLSVLPDADIIAFDFGIPYEHMFGHRGFTHSLFFAFVMAGTISYLLFPSLKRTAVFLYLFICTASHGILDAMTTGGRGIAFFAPFSDERYFFPWRIIQVSPLRARHFFSEWGLEVIKSELIWIGLPCLLLFILQPIKKAIISQ